MTVYDKNGQPYDADLVVGEEFRTLKKELADTNLANAVLESENEYLRKRNLDASEAFAFTIEQWRETVEKLKTYNANLYTMNEVLRATIANPTSL
jgi:hypothetical protein